MFRFEAALCQPIHARSSCCPAAPFPLLFVILLYLSVSPDPLVFPVFSSCGLFQLLGVILSSFTSFQIWVRLLQVIPLNFSSRFLGPFGHEASSVAWF